jgi:hypothetical protein
MAGGGSVIMLSPPLAVTKDQIDFAIDVIGRNLAICDAEVNK